MNYPRIDTPQCTTKKCFLNDYNTTERFSFDNTQNSRTIHAEKPSLHDFYRCKNCSSARQLWFSNVVKRWINRFKS